MIGEVDEMLRNIKEWSSPERVGISLILCSYLLIPEKNVVLDH